MDSKKRARLIAIMAGLSLLLLGACHANRKARSESLVKAADGNTAVELKAAKPTEAKPAEKSAEEIDLPFKQEVRQSYKLAPNAIVSISGISGSLEVETSGADTAEIYIVRSVSQQDDFNDRDLTIETQSGNSRIVRSVSQGNLNDRDPRNETQSEKLRIRIQQQRKRSFWSMLTPRGEEHQRAYLKLPRQIQFNAGGIKGVTRIGEIGGRVELNGINGPVTVARATSGAELGGINGNIEITLTQLAKGLQAHGINGNINLRFAGPVNADLEVHGINGNVNPELPNVTVTTQRRGFMEARIGNGGAPIEFGGVRGNINLLPALVAQATKPNTVAARTASR